MTVGHIVRTMIPMILDAVDLELSTYDSETYCTNDDTHDFRRCGPRNEYMLQRDILYER